MPSPDSTLLGILLTIAAYFLFAFQDASIKILVAALPVWQIMFCRSVTVVAACLALGRGRLLRRLAATPNRRGLALRAVLTLAAWLCYYSAAADMPLAQLQTLYFASPLMVTVLAMPLLGERVTPIRWAAATLGFAGVAIASNPLGARIGLPAMLVLLAAILWALAVILMRRLAREEASLTQLFTTNLGFLVATGAACVFTWHPPNPWQMALLAGLGVFGGIGQFLLFEAAAAAPASVTSTYEYTALLWATIFGYLVWHDLPSLPVVSGAGIILGAGLLLAWREQQDRLTMETP